METTITKTIENRKSFNLNIIDRINSLIEKEKDNAIGISIALVMFGTGLASLTAALALYEGVSIFILMTATILAMSTNVAAISQQPLKTLVWMFIINISVNAFLLIYQIIELL